MNDLNKFSGIILAALLGLLFSLNGFCSDNPDHKLTGFDYLFKITENEKTSFDPEKISSIIEHVLSGNSGPVKMERLAGLENTTFAYQGFDVDVDMSRLLKYAFNPDIPANVVAPSEIRLSSWMDMNGKKMAINPPLWSRLSDNQAPAVIHGLYYIQNTPESSTGAYFGYTSFKTVILCRYKSHNVLISVMKQKDVSEVGKKGFTMGPKEDPEYFYSGEQGLTIRGLGWIKSYLYDSCSVSVYFEKKEHEKGLKCGIFKWIRGGWAGSNMVRVSHAQKGLERYSNEFKYILELKDLPSPEELADVYTSINSLHPDEMKKRVETLILSIKGKCPVSPACPKALKSDSELENYVNRMNRMELSSTLFGDFVKHCLLKSDKQGKFASTHDSSPSKMY